jgi:hypothetical protein
MPAVVYYVQLEEGGQEMMFTDKQLRQWKQALKNKEGGYFSPAHFKMLSALLTRLEAAENCLHHVVSDKPLGDCACLDAWLKAAGTVQGKRNHANLAR